MAHARVWLGRGAGRSTWAEHNRLCIACGLIIEPRSEAARKGAGRSAHDRSTRLVMAVHPLCRNIESNFYTSFIFSASTFIAPLYLCLPSPLEFLCRSVL